MYLLALQLRIFLPTEMTDFLSLSRTYISVYLKREKGPGGGGGDSAYERDGDARRLA